MTEQRDFIDSLGILTLAHRFKRMMQRLMDESAEIHQRLGLPIKPRWGSTLLLLEAEGPLSVTEVAERLRLTHPAVVQSLDDMAGMGLVRRAKDRSDQRVVVVCERAALDARSARGLGTHGPSASGALQRGGR